VSTLGSFVIHGNNADTLERALATLRPVSDYLVAVDSGSSDGSRDIALKYADRVETFSWQGYGAARARAWEMLHAAGVEWTFFLDSDEFLADSEAATLSHLVRRCALEKPVYRVAVRNLDMTDPVPSVFYTHHRVRLFRRPTNPWSPAQIVHESFPRGRYPRLKVAVEHRFLCGDMSTRLRKDKRYALLWAIQHAGARKPYPPPVAWLSQVWRDLILRGAVFRGGLRAVRIACRLAEYSWHKCQYMREVAAGGHSDLVALYRGGELGELCRRVSASI
jgi:glycosyltransferase involved in cell wall biosynthesis